MVDGKVSSRMLVKGAFVLTIAAFISKILSAVYRIPFQNIVGDIGFYIYQQVYPFYGIAIALSTYGFPVIISKLLAERYEENDLDGVNLVLRSAFLLLSFIGVSLFLCVHFGAGWIATLMGDRQLELLIKIISLSFLFLPFLSTLRGYFQGKGDMIPTAVSQVVEQLVRVITILAFSFVLISAGYSLYYAGGGALFGSLTGGVMAIFILSSFLIIRKDRSFIKIFKGSWREHFGLIKILGLQGTAICISGMLLVLLQFIDAFSVYSYLVASGMNENEAKEIKGVYDRGQPLIQLGTVVATSISLTAVPLITAAYKQKDFKAVKEYILLALKVSMIVGLGASIGLINLIDPVNTMLFENSKGSSVLAVFCLAIFFTSLILTLSSILQGVGKLYVPAIIIILGVLLKYGLNKWLIPTFATMGASVSTVLVLVIMTMGFVLILRRVFPIPFLAKEFYFTAVFSLMGMTAVIQIWLRVAALLTNLMPERVASVGMSLGGVIIGGLVYITLIVNSKMVNEKEIALLPLGSKLLRLKRRQE
ncbi:putative polysaccharide biosynthesis protein [Bacillus sp. 2205SS5-2]|uniref:putative polysaccharide biosynthesis protein n=1 Tax=Bacillus sp. 2205SS5-2 TaxID=3109031 RepID=UPI00300546C0